MWMTSASSTGNWEEKLENGEHCDSSGGSVQSLDLCVCVCVCMLAGERDGVIA